MMFAKREKIVSQLINKSGEKFFNLEELKLLQIIWK